MKKQQGFAIVQLLLGLIVAGAIVGVGLYVYTASNSADQSNDNAQQAGDSSIKSTGNDSGSATADVSIVPFEVLKLTPGQYTVRSKKYGFEFSYPDAFGEMASYDEINNEYKMPDDKNLLDYYVTNAGFTSERVYKEGVLGEISVAVHKKGTTMATRKYGPTVELQGGKWIVVEENASDVINNKVGDEYRDFSGAVVAAEDVNGISVYTFQSGDEGSTDNTCVFEVGEYLVSIRPGGYFDGQYGSSAQSEANSKEPYTALLTQVKNSIKKL